MTDINQIRHARIQTMIAFEEGHLPEAELELGKLIKRLNNPQTAHERSELCYLHSERATVRRFANRWDDALSDLEICDGLIRRMGALWQRLMSANVAFLRAKIYADPHTSCYCPEKARNALAIVRRAGNLDFACDEAEATMAYREENWSEAARLSLTAASKLAEQGWLRAAASCRRQAADAYMELSDLGRAEAQMSEAHAYLQSYGGPVDRARSFLTCARFESLKGGHDTAWGMILQALAEIEFLIRRFTVLSEQQRFLIDKLELYQRAFQIVLTASGSKANMRAWTIAERSKSFYLCQLIASADIQIFDDMDPLELDRLRRLEDRLDACERKLPRLSQADRDGLKGQKILEEIKKLVAAKQTQLERMMRQNPRWARLNIPSLLNLKKEIEHLPVGWIPLSFYWQPQKETGATLHIFWVDKFVSIGHAQVEWHADELDRLKQLQGTLRGNVDIFTEVFPDKLASKVFPSELLKCLSNDARILISPHGPLQMLPLHAMHLQDGTAPIDQWSIQYIPSLALLPIQRKIAEKQEILLLGCEQDGFADPPLKDVARELSVLEKLWSDKRPGQVLQRLIAAESSPAGAGIGTETWDRYSEIHIACHGIFPDSQPFDAALRLGSDAIRASEFFLIKLNAKLVILSACALGRQGLSLQNQSVIGDEWIGLMLPLFYSGVGRVIASLWNANSGEAKSLMETLHRCLADGMDPADALRNAQKEIQADSFTSHWSNWFIVGIPK